MSKPSIPRFRMPAGRTAAASVLTLVVAGCAVTFSAFHAKTWHATHPATKGAQTPTLNAEQRGRVRASLEALPLGFEANQGQTDPQVKYTARGNGYSVFLTANDAVFAVTSAKHAGTQSSRTLSAHAPRQAAEQVESASIDMRLLGGKSNPEVTAGDPLPGVINYYVGGDQKDWHTGIRQYSSVSYRDVYPGVNMVFHGAQRQLEFDFVVSPGADPKAIALGFKGARKLNTDAYGNLVLNSSAGDVVLHKPVAYQEKDGKRETVEAAFAVKNSNEVALNLGAYDRQRELVIDPSLTYATYLGGSGEDDAYGIAIDSSGDVYVTGETASTNFPTQSPLQSTNKLGLHDVFISKISADGKSLVYSTYIGGTGDDSGNAIAVDSSLNVYVAGGTTSTNFPTQAPFQSSSAGGVDAFVLELASNGGSLVFSTYLGGGTADVAEGVAVDSTGVYVVGQTTSNPFPTTGGAFQTTLNGSPGDFNGFFTKLNSAGSALVYSTYLGGPQDNVTAVAVDSSNHAYVTGLTQTPTFHVTSGAYQKICGTDGTCNGGTLTDAFVTVFDPSASGSASIVYSTFLGGERADEALAIAIDSAGDAYVTGLTQSSQFPGTSSSAIQKSIAGNQDAFVAELNPTLSSLVYSTYLGGSGDDAGTGIAVDSNKNAYVTGQTNSTNFPTASPTQANLKGTNKDAFVSEISASGSSLAFSTYLGGSLDENSSAASVSLGPIGAIAVDGAGANIYVAGNTASSDFPFTSGSFQTTYGTNTDAFVAKYATGASAASFTVTNGALSNTSGHAGVSATSTITVTSTNGFNSAVTLQCTVSPVVTKGPTCSLDKASVTPPANSTATATLSVATTTASAGLVRPAHRPGAGIIYAIVLPVFGVTLLGAGIQKSSPRRKKFLGFTILGMALTCLLLLPGCGGSSSNNGGGGGGTPTGTYTITVTGTSGANVVTGTPALTLTIN